SPVPEGFRGIKWHRHADEPVYAYGSAQCERIIDEICGRRLPVVLEEEFHNTLNFIKSIAERTVVIIPHMGGLNGGYTRLKHAGVFESQCVWVDTALAHPREIEDFSTRYGVSRILFGSDYPFGIPLSEKRKIEAGFSGDDLNAVIGGNLQRLLRF
ncbi:MAG TPA: amidohydrolase family protein, partial [Desulfomonilaceae bacterium]|nr:amidohydrolase family protein [Desulfomonilaceae bacterium]